VRSALEGLQASGTAPCPEYEVCCSETNPPYFANNDANLIVAKYFRVRRSLANRSIKICVKD